MTPAERQSFQQLCKAVLATYREAHSAAPEKLAAFRKQDITNFQEHLEQLTGGRISEKSFYTYFKKKDHGKLPRIDVLNLLSQYVGKPDWRAFEPQVSTAEKQAVAPRFWVLGIAMSLIFIAGFWWSSSPVSKTTYEVCVYDRDTRQLVATQPIEVLWLRVGETPVSLTVDTLGCVVLPEIKEASSFVIQAPYYLPDTLVRTPGQRSQREIFYLKPDDYALMIHYFSQSKVADWQKHRAQLEQVIAPHARILQVQQASLRGVELMNRTEFIRKLTSPFAGLKGIEVLETQYEGDRIVYLRFTQPSTNQP